MTDDLLPNNATPLERSISGAGARMLAVDTDAIRIERQPAHCDAQFVPFLAWERSIHFYDPADPAGNRARIQSSFNDHLKYGSPPALEAEIALDTGQTVQVVEYFEEAGLEWPDFVLASVVNAGDPLPDIDALMASALMRKNVRDWPLPRVRARPAPPALAYVGAATGVIVSAKILPTAPPPPQVYVGAATGVVVTARILPLGVAT